MIITTYIVIIYSWLRCVFIPLIGSITGFYSSFDSLGVIGTINSLQTATHLIAYEQLIISILLFLYSSIKSSNTEQKFKTSKKLSIKLEGNKSIYLIYVFFVLIVYLVFGRNLDLFQFVLISVEETTRRGDLTETSDVIIRQIISSGMIFLFLLVLETLRRIYNLKNKDIYITLALIAALFLISIIMGERRSTQLYLAFATTWVLLKVFPIKRKKIISTISLATLTILVLMSIYKFFNAFLYGSYIEAISKSDINLSWFAATLDGYFFGVSVVSSNIVFGELAQVDIKNMLFDFTRSIFGLSFLFKFTGQTTSELYNLTIYKGVQSSGHLFSSVGYGYIYLGYFLAPIITWLNIFIAIKLESLMRKTKSIEMNFILSYIFMRFAFGLFGNPVPLINSGTSFFIINGVIFLGAFLLALNKYRDIKYKYTLKERGV